MRKKNTLHHFFVYQGLAFRVVFLFVPVVSLLLFVPCRLGEKALLVIRYCGVLTPQKYRMPLNFPESNALSGHDLQLRQLNCSVWLGADPAECENARGGRINL